MLMAHRPLVRAQDPALQQRRYPVDPRHQLRGRLLLAFQKSDLVSIAVLFERNVTQPSVCVHRATGFNGLLRKPDQALRGRVWNPFHSNPSDPWPIFLCRDYNQGLAFRLSASLSLFQAAQIRFIHFHPPTQTIPAWPHHRSPQLVQPRPGRLVAAQPQHSLQPQRTGPVLLARQPVNGPEPIHQRFARVLENRPCRHRCLMTTFLALHEHRPYRPEVTAAATRAAKAFWPSKLEQILPARLLGIKPCFELAQIPRIFLHSPTYYMLGSPESSKYPPLAIPDTSANPDANGLAPRDPSGFRDRSAAAPCLPFSSPAGRSSVSRP